MLGGVNHLKAIFDLLSIAVQDKEITYFHIISGQDFPVKNMNDFYTKFDKCSNIYMTCIGEKDFPDVVKDRLSYYVLNANLDSRKRIVRLMNWITKKALNLLGKQRKSLGEFSSIYKGMVWISMPMNAGRYAFHYVQEHPEFMTDLEHTLIPEEFFFQTIFMNSEYRNKVVFDNLRYTDWTSRNGGIPAYLDDSDYSKIISSGAYFARKMNSSISKELVSKLVSAK